MIMLNLSKNVLTLNLLEIQYSCNVTFNPFVPNPPFLYPLKTSENRKAILMFSGGRERVHWEQMG